LPREGASKNERKREEQISDANNGIVFEALPPSSRRFFLFPTVAMQAGESKDSLQVDYILLAFPKPFVFGRR
jgi:hypothetical protein